MTVVIDTSAPPPTQGPEVPREIDPGRSTSDRTFEGTVRTVGYFVLVLTGSIGLFLGYQAIPTLRHYGFSFFTESDWLPEQDKVGISAVLLGTFEVAAVAMVIAFPLGLLTALYISEYAPSRLKALFVSLVDLMAAVPSIVYGLWGFFLLEPHAIYFSRW
ncbi:MAG: PstC family ABC transporter permease, partial [Actinomycetes bacterium]